MTLPLPAEMTPFGHIVGRAVRAVGDTAGDEDSDPEVIPITGEGVIRFAPISLSRVITSTDPNTLVAEDTVKADLDSEGYLSLSGHRGLSLWPGVWSVSSEPGDLTFPTFKIEVAAAQTAENPLQLWGVRPPDPVPGETVYTLVVPTDMQPGQSLVWDGGKLVWATPKITPTATTLAAGSNATATMSGSWPNLTLGLGIPAGQPSTYQIVGAGRPDVPASMTTAVQAQVAAAPVGAIFSSTDGASVGAWQWQKLPDGWIVSYGNTGWCDLTGQLINGATATTVAWKRNMSGECVRLLKAVLPTGTFLYGFSEIFPVYWGLVLRNGGYDVLKSSNGSMYCPQAFTTGTENLYFNIPIVRKSSWVTVLPGPVIP